MNILYLTPFNPLERDGGGFLRSAYLWKVLKNVADVDTVVFTPCATNLKDNINRVWSAYGNARKSKLRFNIIKFLSVLFKKMDWLYYDEQRIREILGCGDKKYDFVVVRYEYVAMDTAAWKIAPVYCDFDDLPSEVFWTIKSKGMIFWKRVVHYFLERFFEQYIARQCKGIWISNPNHVRLFESATNVCCLRNVGTEPSSSYSISRASSQEKKLMIIGAVGYKPNCEGINWFLDNIWKFVSLKHPALKLDIVGRIPASMAHCAGQWQRYKGVRVCGFVENLDDAYRKTICTVAPIRSGSGTCVKVIEAAMFGRMTLATPFACRGLSKEDLRKLGISLFSNACDFECALSKILSMESDDVKRHEEEIMKYANARYSMEGFAAAVNNLLPLDAKHSILM